jgi:branched-chain amino acid transport system permease protein
MGLDDFLQPLVYGVTLGALYGLIALGYTMVYGIIGMINFAHGDIYMVGAFMAMIGFVLFSSLGLASVPVAILLVLALAMAFTGLYGWAVERVAYRPLRGSPRLAPLITAIGMSIVLQNFVQVSQGARDKAQPPMVTGQYSIDLGDGGQVTITLMRRWAAPSARPNRT